MTTGAGASASGCQSWCAWPPTVVSDGTEGNGRGEGRIPNGGGSPARWVVPKRAYVSGTDAVYDGRCRSHERRI